VLIFFFFFFFKKVGLDVTYAADLSTATAGTIAPSGAGLQFYRGSYADLVASGFTTSSTVGQICLMVTAGSITLNSFAVGAYSFTRTCAIRVYDANASPLYVNTTELIPSAARRVFSGPWTSPRGICLQLGGDFYNVGLGLIDFSYASTATTTVATTTVPATTVVPTLPPNTQRAILSFTGLICRNGQSCSDYDLIDQVCLFFFFFF
jgi:hypothetical protein